MPDNDLPDDDFDPDYVSKSQRKRDVHALRDLGARLLDVPNDQLEKISEPRLIDAVLAARKITRGSARRRQLQYIGKLIRTEDLGDEVQQIVDRLDAGSRAHTAHFHQLELWRSRLIEGDDTALSEIIESYPDVDIQHLRQLSRQATSERDAGRLPPVHYRKLFQYLKQISESPD